MTENKISLRRCLGCRAMKPKSELIRIVRLPQTKDENNNANKERTAIVDLTGKINGRGAYLCRDEKCLQFIIKTNRIERTLSCKITEEIYEKLESEISAFNAENKEDSL